ncbi:MAG: GNAT family N-acetyltransferase [Anaerolineae bacterium]
MAELTIRPFTAADGEAILALQMRYAEVFPGAQVIPPPVYAGPGFDGGHNVLCAFATDGALLGYTAAFAGAPPAAGSGYPLIIWAVVKVDPALAQPLPVQEALYERLLGRVAELRPTLPPGAVELRFEYLPTDTPAIDDAYARGFTHVASAYGMGRDLALPIETAPAPAEVAVRQWKIEGEEGQRRYLEARNRCFVHAPWNLASLRYLLASPLWQEGTSITAFDGEEVIGSVLAYWDEEANARTGVSGGYTEEVFVVPEWRGRGIGRYLLAEALCYLRRHGLARAELQVLVSNDAALDLYRGLGYVAESETWHLARDV